MNRKKFLKHLGGTSLATMIPLSATMAALKNKKSVGTKTKEKIVRDKEGTELIIFGNPQYHKVTGEETNSQMFEWVEHLKPGSGIPTHVHTKEDEVFRVLSGQLEITVDGKSTVLNPGDMAFAPKNIPHSWRVIGDKEAKMSTTAFPSGMEHMFHDLGAMPPGKPDFAKVAEICSKYGINFIK